MLYDIAFFVILAGISGGVVVSAGTALFNRDLIIRNGSVATVLCMIIAAVLLDAAGSGFPLIARFAIAAVAVFVVLALWPEK